MLEELKLEKVIMGVNWLVLLMVMVMLARNVQSADPSSTFFDFSAGFNGREAELSYQGDAYIPSDKPTSIRLTAADHISLWRPTPLQNRVGRVLYSPPIRLWDRVGRRQATFQTVITGSMENPWSHMAGDGISFFIAPVDTSFPTNSTDGNMGLYDSSSGTSPAPLFAVELDHHRNTWDPTYTARHLGINVNSRKSVADTSWLGEPNARVLEARITYDSRERLITVVVNSTGFSSSSRPSISRLEHAFELKTLLPEWVQIGISASTGIWGTALHDIHTWSFISFMLNDDTFPNFSLE